MAGLVAAYELQRAGVDVTVLEAQQRVGGRILTLREPFSPGLHAEAGAMRVPVTHKLTRTYIEKFGLQTSTFTKANPNAFFYFKGRRHLRKDVERDPACLGPDLLAASGDQTVLALWEEIISQTAEQLAVDEAYSDELVGKYGDCSLYDFLMNRQWSTEAITAFGLASGLESVFGASFLEVLRIALAWHDAGLLQIAGGMDRLPKAFLPELGSRIWLGAEMLALDYTCDSVTVYYKSQTGLARVSADFAILTLPYPALRFVDVLKPFSPAKQTVTRQLHYTDIAKVHIQCRRRFWEEDDGIFGGATVTDLPIRAIYYPDHGRETGRGVLLSCFAYADDATLCGSLSPEDRIAQTLKYLSQIHPQAAGEFEGGVSKVWSQDSFAGGTCALFEPGQQARLYPT